MTMNDRTTVSKFGKAPLSRLQRMAARAEKGAVLQMARRAPRALDFGALAQHPLYRRLEKALLGDDVKALLAAHGLDSALEVGYMSRRG